MFAIECWPLQTYVSALLYSPTRSNVRLSFENDTPHWVEIQPEITGDWSNYLQRLEVGATNITSMDFNSTRLVVAKGSEVSMWDPVKGRRLNEYDLKLHCHVTSVALSHDSSTVAVALRGSMIQLWDIVSGQYRHTLKDNHMYRKIEAPEISEEMNPRDTIRFQDVDEVVIATLPRGSKQPAWNAGSGQHQHTLSGNRTYQRTEALKTRKETDSKDTVRHQDLYIVVVAFSQDSKQLASASESGKLQVWDLDAKTCCKELDVASNIVWGTFSVDLSRFAYESFGEIFIFNLEDKARSRIACHDAPGMFGSLTKVATATSRSMTKAAFVTPEAEIQIRNLDSGNILQTISVEQKVSSITLSQDSTQLASRSLDGTVEIWDLDTYQTRQKYGDYKQESMKSFVDQWPQGLRGFRILLSPDSTHLALVDGTNTTNIWAVQDGRRYTLDSHTECIVFSQRDSTRLFSGLRNGQIRLWNLSTRTCLQTFEGHTDCVFSITISPDSTQLVSVSRDGTAKLWNILDGKCAHTIAVDKNYSCVHAALSSDSKLMALEKSNRVVEILEIGNHGCDRKLSIPRYTRTTSMTFSREPTRLAIASESFVVSIWDVHNDTRLHTIDCKDQVNQMSFDSTGLFLSTNVGMIDIRASLDSSVGTGIVPAKYCGLALEEDGRKITHNSKLLIWLPREYRAKPGFFDIAGNVVALLDRSGRLWLHKFDLNNLP
jgi:WD40 repeat protein